MITRVFKGCTRSSKRRQAALLVDLAPSPDDPFPRPGHDCDNKRTCLRYECTFPGVMRVAAQITLPLQTNVNVFPLRRPRTRRGVAYQMDFSPRLGSAHPSTIAVNQEPFPTSVFTVRTRIIATTTKIGTRGRSSPAHAVAFAAGPPRPPTPRHKGAAGRVSVAHASAPSIFRAERFGR